MAALRLRLAVGACKRTGLMVAAMLALAISLASCTGSEASEPHGINEGNHARDFTLESLDGQEVSLSDFRGRVVLVNFWATWCAPCRDEMPGFEAVYRAHKDDGFVVLGVNLQETPEMVEPFVELMEVTYPILMDQNGAVTREYRALGLPTSILVTTEGLIHTRHVGYLPESVLEEKLQELLP